MAKKPAPTVWKASIKPRTLKVKTAGLPRAGYTVHVGSGLIASSFEGLVGKGQGGRALVVVDAKVPRETIEPLIRRLDGAGVRWAAKVVTATEADKSLVTLEATLVEAARLRLERGDLIIAVGGGIVTDLAGFAAGVYRRGVRIVHCPTTLLAMVDAAVGGKTAANLSVRGEDGKEGLLKNAVGVFHQPARVVCDVASLHSLQLRELKSGLAECVKHGMLSGGLGDKSLLAWIEKRVGEFLSLDQAALSELVMRNVAIKAKVVQADEREESTKADGGRMMLNLGHTFAHAIETLPGLAWKDPAQGVQMVGPLKHGEAVGVGLVCAARVSASLKLCEKGLAERVESLLNRCGLPTKLEGLPATAQIVEHMGHDKKVAAGKLRLVLPVKGGRTRVRDDVPVKFIAAAIDAARV